MKDYNSVRLSRNAAKSPARTAGAAARRGVFGC